MSDALPAEIAVKLALTTRLTDAYVTLDAAELSTWQAWTAADSRPQSHDRRPGARCGPADGRNAP